MSNCQRLPNMASTKLGLQYQTYRVIFDECPDRVWAYRRIWNFVIFPIGYKADTTREKWHYVK